jgi:hypothetical protein
MIALVLKRLRFAVLGDLCSHLKMQEDTTETLHNVMSFATRMECYDLLTLDIQCCWGTAQTVADTTNEARIVNRPRRTDNN